MRSRLKTFSQFLTDHDLDAYLVISPSDIAYLTGFSASGAWLLVMAQRAYYLTDSRYSDEARQALGKIARVWVCRNGLERGVVDILNQFSRARVGIDENHFFVAKLKKLKQACGTAIRIHAVNGAVARLRVFKDADEIAQIRQCIATNKEAYRYLRRILKPGLAEREVLWKLQDFTRRKNVGFAFDPIIASGPNSAFPHASISSRIIKNNDIILIDLGIRMNGYNSDLTRIFLSDKIAHPIRDVYQAVADAQEAAISQIKDGVAVAHVDLAARKSLRKKKLEKFFTHALGHGVGLEIHESPRLSVHSADVLRAGMVVTVEPGVYISGKFGIRIEDMVLVTETGCDILSRGGTADPPFFI